MARSAAQANWNDKHKERPYHDGHFRNWSADRGPTTPFRFDEGVSIWVATSDLDPDDDWL